MQTADVPCGNTERTVDNSGVKVDIGIKIAFFEVWIVESDFFKYFVLNFNRLGLKNLVATCYFSSPIMGSQLRCRADTNGQMELSFEEDAPADDGAKRPYKAVVGYGGSLDIRPRYQREFVYKDAQRDEVVRTVMKGLPLNVMYWCRGRRSDGTEGFEVLDGQQRIISVCEYVDGSFSVDDKYFYNLPSDKQRQIFDYTLFIYTCDGNSYNGF